jgi:hypothetical protein
MTTKHPRPIRSRVRIVKPKDGSFGCVVVHPEDRIVRTLDVDPADAVAELDGGNPLDVAPKSNGHGVEAA